MVVENVWYVGELLNSPIGSFREIASISNVHLTTMYSNILFLVPIIADKSRWLQIFRLLAN